MTLKTLLLFRELPDSFREALSRNTQDPIDLGLARQQHDTYIQACIDAACSGAGKTQALILPKLNPYPDSVFIEDCLLFLGEKRLLLTNPGAPSRRPETDDLLSVLRERLPSDFLLYTSKDNPDALFDGGDILKIGSTLYVGLSERTNEEGLRELTRICGNYGIKVWPVRVGEEALHLKSLVTFLGPQIGLVASNTDGGHRAIEQILLREGQMPVYYFDDMLTANMLRIGQTIFYPQGSDIKHLQKACQHDPNIIFRALDMSELNKKDGALTCCSVIASG